MKNTYRVKTYKTITGKFDSVDLGDFTYGEWIIYENETPKYHVAVFREDSESDARIKELIENKNETIESILEQINSKHSLNLNLGKWPLIKWLLKSELKELSLVPLPNRLLNE